LHHISLAVDRIVIAEDPQRRATFRIQTARQAMVKPFPSKTHIGNHMLHPETLMLNYGYDPQLSEWSRQTTGLPNLNLRLQDRRRRTGFL
jgi:hypothetical protein